jgi:hypothetical protein
MNMICQSLKLLGGTCFNWISFDFRKWCSLFNSALFFSMMSFHKKSAGQERWLRWDRDWNIRWQIKRLFWSAQDLIIYEYFSRFNHLPTHRGIALNSAEGLFWANDSSEVGRKSTDEIEMRTFGILTEYPCNTELTEINNVENNSKAHRKPITTPVRESFIA